MFLWNEVVSFKVDAKLINRQKCKCVDFFGPFSWLTVLKDEDLETPFLLMWPSKKGKVFSIHVCLGVGLVTPEPDFLEVSFPYLVLWVSNHFLASSGFMCLWAAILSHRQALCPLFLKSS